MTICFLYPVSLPHAHWLLDTFVRGENKSLRNSIFLFFFSAKSIGMINYSVNYIWMSFVLTWLSMFRKYYFYSKDTYYFPKIMRLEETLTWGYLFFFFFPLILIFYSLKLEWLELSSLRQLWEGGNHFFFF